MSSRTSRRRPSLYASDGTDRELAEAAPVEHDDRQDRAELDGDRIGVSGRLSHAPSPRSSMRCATRRCPVDDTGRYSVNPSTAPRMIAFSGVNGPSVFTDKTMTATTATTAPAVRPSRRFRRESDSDVAVDNWVIGGAPRQNAM